jgi:hypothetical protein
MHPNEESKALPQPISLFTNGILFRGKIIARQISNVTTVAKGISTIGFIAAKLTWNLNLVITSKRNGSIVNAQAASMALY